MMKKRKLGIIGGTVFIKWKVLKNQMEKISTPWGKPSDEILLASIGKKKFVLYQDTLEDIKSILQI